MNKKQEDSKFGSIINPRLPIETIDILYKTRDEYLKFELSDINLAEVEPIIGALYASQGLEKPKITIKDIDEIVNTSLNHEATLHNTTLVPFIFAWKALSKKVNLQSQMYADITNQLQNFIETRMNAIVNGITSISSLDSSGRRIFTRTDSRLDAMTNYLTRKRSRLALYDFFIRAGIIDEPRITEFLRLEKNGVFAAIFGKKEVILFRRPQIRMNATGQLSSLKEPAIMTLTHSYHFIDGVYFNDEKIWNGIANHTISPIDLIRLTNAEWKSIGIKEIGYDKLLKSMNSAIKIIDKYKTENFRKEPITYQLLELDLGDDRFIERLNGKAISDEERANSSHTFFLTRMNSDTNDTKIITTARFVKVQDHSVLKETILRVPPNIKDCMEAIAWTFSMEGKLYKPKEER
jgi:hypothetical protein